MAIRSQTQITGLTGVLLRAQCRQSVIGGRERTEGSLRHMGLRARLAATVCAPLFAVALLTGSALAHDLGPLGPALDDPIPPSWQVTDRDDVVFLSNDDQEAAPFFLIYPAGPAPKPARSSLLGFNIISDNPRASLSLFLGNTTTRETCMAEVNSLGDAALLCINDQGATEIGSLSKIAKMDGSDTIQIIEQDNEAVFLVNQVELGVIRDHGAMNSDLGLMAMGQGAFGLGHFSTYIPPSEGFPAKGNADANVPQNPYQDTGQAQSSGDQILARAFAASQPRPGWSETVEGDDVVTINDTHNGDERIIGLDIGTMPAGGRLIEARIGVSPAGNAPQSIRAAAGLQWSNRQTGQSCSVQITAVGDGLLVCWSESGRASQMGRLKAVAHLDGHDVVSVVETSEGLEAYVNAKSVGKLSGHPSLGGDIAVIAHERGRFRFGALEVKPLQQEAAPSGQAQAPQLDTRRPDFSLGDELAGPLPRFGADDERMIAAYIGISQSILMHELGHALIGELSVPSTGPEEDAVDIYSALQVVEPALIPSGNEGVDRMAQMAATYGALAWFYSGKLAEQQGLAETPWQDEHTADLKRFRNMFCVMYGAYPALFSPLAGQIGLEERTLARCEEEFSKQNRAWRSILAPYTRISADNPEGLLPADAQGAKIEVVFEPSKRQIGEYIRRAFGEAIKNRNELYAQTYVLPRPLRITYRDCDQLNAWYAPADGEITMCYDIIEHFSVMISDIELGTEGGYDTPQSREAVKARQEMQGQAPKQEAAFDTKATTAPAPSFDAMDELAEAGMPQTQRLFPGPYRGATPNSHPQAEVLTTQSLYELLDHSAEVHLLDIRPKNSGNSLPLAYGVPDLGRDGSLTDGLQSRVLTFIEQLTQGNNTIPIVIFGDGPEDRAAYNAALRVGSGGYRALWYRGGIAAWTANRLPLAPLE